VGENNFFYAIQREILFFSTIKRKNIFCISVRENKLFDAIQREIYFFSTIEREIFLAFQ